MRIDLLNRFSIARSLRRGGLVEDRVFDKVFPPAVRARSDLYWTPVEVAVRAANLLADRAGATILDIGSGVGKFCIVAGAAVNANVHGIEHRPHLVEIARAATYCGFGGDMPDGFALVMREQCGDGRLELWVKR